MWSLESSLTAYKEGRIQEWIEGYLLVPEWENHGLLRRVREYSSAWEEPKLYPISELYRVAGPGPSFVFAKDESEWAESIDEIVAANPSREDFPPLIAWRELDGVINLADGNHRIDALSALGHDQAWVIVHDGPLRGEEETARRKDEFAQLSKRFELFADECEGSSPLYRHLSLCIAADAYMLNLARACQAGQPKPNLLFAAIHRVLRDHPEDELGQYYPSFSSSPKPIEDIYPAFRRFASRHDRRIRVLLATRLVQTNEVQRSTVLFPSFLTRHRQFTNRKIHLIELGASAGLNLLWDKYGYRYGVDGEYGSTDAELVLSSEFRGERRPDMTGPIPEVSHRIGVDINPISLDDPEELAWLQALIWPEHHERRERLLAASEVLHKHHVDLVAGDGAALLPGLLDQISEDDVAYVFHTWVANQMSSEQRNELMRVIDEFGQTRDIVHIHNNIEPHLHATIYRSGTRTDIPLANVDGHARWIEWLT